MYKTISYPKNESGTGEIERLRFVIANSGSSDFVDWLARLSSKEVRHILGQQYVDLLASSDSDNSTLSETALEILKAYYKTLNFGLVNSSGVSQQLSLIGGDEPVLLGKHGTFTPNHIESIHRWYPYIEGFSSTFVENLINKWAAGAKKVYDPFAGTGTTLTVAALNNIEGYYSEVNPFMRLVIDVKSNVLKRLPTKKYQLSNYLDQIVEGALTEKVSLVAAKKKLDSTFPGKPFFIGDRLVDIVSIKNAIAKIPYDDEDFVKVAKLIIGSIGVPSSEMKRASDLRYRRKNELLPDTYQVLDEFRKKAAQILDDIDERLEDMASTVLVGENALYPNKIKGDIDLVLTSPPYLNGTNYFRNTKIELWLAGFIEHENELGNFNREAMIAGINNVSKASRQSKELPFVEEVAKKLDKVAYDKRIPTLVRGYSSDTELWLTNCANMLTNDGKIIIDIGDSKFCGVYVPTDEFIVRIAEKIGLKLVDTELVRKRNSNDGTPLKQVLLTFSKQQKISRNSSSKSSFLTKAKEFEKLPYTNPPYASRNWGSSLHSLCSYQGKLKPAIAHFLVTNFTDEGDVVLDPMSGAGTIPLEAFLNNRKAYANDLQSLGFMLSTAKVDKPVPSKVLAEADRLISYVENNWTKVDVESYSHFGLNGKLPEYYDKRTLAEVLAAREYLLKNDCNSVNRALVYSSLLHILHGNRPYALSRQSHPVTPFKPTGDFEYRDLRTRLYDKVARALKSHDESNFISGKAFNLPFEHLVLDEKVDAVITSPPFTASTRFYVSNWLRLWMSGWEPEHFKTKKDDFLEEKQKKSMDVYKVFFDKCDEWLKPSGKLILHLGKTKKVDMAKELLERIDERFQYVHSFDEDVADREKFGVKDQGATFAHQFLFLRKV